MPSDRIGPHTDLFLNRPRHAVYIDDCIILGHDPGTLSALQRQYIDVVDDVGIPAKPSKVVLPTCDPVECLGFEVDGRRLSVGVAVPKLVGLTRQLLARGSSTGLQLAHLVGKWSWSILARRPAFSVFNSVYRFIQKAGRRHFDIWPSVTRELRTIIDIAPLLFSSLDRLWFRRVVATDASSAGMGVVSTTLGDDLAASFAGLGPTSTQHFASLPSHRWSTIVSTPWSSLDTPEHINVLEIRAVTTALRWVLSSPSSIRRRLLVFTDSSVAALAISKGRSSSFQILRRLRYLSSLVLAAGLQLFCRWLPSELNPADGPSRSFGW